MIMQWIHFCMHDFAALFVTGLALFWGTIGIIAAISVARELLHPKRIEEVDSADAGPVSIQ